ncbi:MAG: 4a-hydroxytetrahydrobiopterin dehydratase [Candidatus Bathyarchaeia archaeon]
MRLSKRRIKLQLAITSGWRLTGREISRAFVFEDFARSIRFVSRIAKCAESMNHHPDIIIRYNKVRLTLTTYDEGGLTMKDFRLAQKINRIVK